MSLGITTDLVLSGKFKIACCAVCSLIGSEGKPFESQGTIFFQHSLIYGESRNILTDPSKDYDAWKKKNIRI
jgi:hypothetical protein